MFNAYNTVNSSLNVIKTDSGGSGIYIYYNGYVVTVYISIVPSQPFSGNSWNIIGNILEQLRPPRQIDFALADNSATTQASNNVILGRIDANGDVKIYVYSDKTKPSPDGTVTYVL